MCVSECPLARVFLLSNQKTKRVGIVGQNLCVSCVFFFLFSVCRNRRKRLCHKCLLLRLRTMIPLVRLALLRRRRKAIFVTNVEYYIMCSVCMISFVLIYPANNRRRRRESGRWTSSFRGRCTQMSSRASATRGPRLPSRAITMYVFTPGEADGG